MTDTFHTTLTDTELDTDLPVVVEYEIDGLFEVALLSVRPELFGLGEDILDTLSTEDIRDIEQRIVRSLDWKTPYGYASDTGEPLFRRGAALRAQQLDDDWTYGRREVW